ncbi:MAG TPA: protein kinase, partial [Myxococcaceae bacterium]|nr:protein kinase [Myxococcaceae bacterium]
VLKILRRDFLSDDNTVARFRREARAASRLRHPNSIRILDFGQVEDGALYMAMEYVSGKDLHTIFAEQFPLPEARTAQLMAQVLSALGAAHRAGVIHRDLKPENVMVAPAANGTEAVKVLDFGIAKIQPSGAGEELTALTKAGFVCGTPEYMSPEQARGADLDSRSDLYSVGVILYQLCCGSLPFESDSALGLASKHLHEAPVPPSQRRPGTAISPALERLILRAMSKDPVLRPQTAAEFRSELLASAGLQDREEATRTELGPPRELWESTATGRTARGMSIKGDWRLPLRRGMWVAAGLAVLGLTALTVRSARKALAAPRAAAVSEAFPPPGDLSSPRRLEQEGDAALLAGDLKLAADRYGDAYTRSPTPDLSLKLGELHFRKRRFSEARRYWQAHLRQRPDSGAQVYIRHIFSDL